MDEPDNNGKVVLSTWFVVKNGAFSTGLMI